GPLWVRIPEGGSVGLRRAPALLDRAEVFVPDGERVDDLCGDARADNMVWRRVRTPTGAVGYVPTQYLAPNAPPPPTATPIDPTDPFTQWSGLFAGTWSGHGRTLEVRPDGGARYEWRT